MSINKYGEPYLGDSKFVASCRLLQSVYRTEIGENIRPYRGRDKNYYLGNYIDCGEESGVNWKSAACVTPEAQVPLTPESNFRMTPIKS